MNSIDLIINGKNARTEWGVVTTLNTLGALLAFPALKEMPEFSSRLEGGSRIDTENPLPDAREITLEIQLTAATPALFYSRLEALRSELGKGSFTLYTSDRPETVYRLVYRSCTQFTQFRRGIAVFSLKVTEPNPDNRKSNTAV